MHHWRRLKRNPRPISQALLPQRQQLAERLEPEVVQKRVFNVASRSSISIPLADLITEGRLEIYSQVEERGFFNLNFRGTELQLIAGPYVGLIPICPGVTINVQPRLPVSNIGRVLEVAQKPLGVLANVDRTYAWYDQSTNSILEFLARSLLKALEPIEVHGFDRVYDIETVLSSSPRGRIRIKDTYARAIARGFRHKAVSARFRQSIDTAANRTIKAALWLAAVRLGRARPAAGLMAELNRALLRLEGVSLVPGAAMSLSRDPQSYRRPLSTRQYYADALRVSLAILSERGLSLDFADSDFELSSFILNFEDVFEAYARGLLAIELSHAGAFVADGNKAPALRPLFDDVPTPPAQPDIVITRNGVCAAVAEVKYKESTNRDNLNQLIAYAVRYRAPKAIMIHLSRENQRGVLKRLGRIQGSEFFSLPFDLSASPLEDEETSFVSAVASVL